MSAVTDQEKKVAVKEGPASVAGTDYMAFLNSGKATVKKNEVAQTGETEAADELELLRLMIQKLHKLVTNP